MLSSEHKAPQGKFIVGEADMSEGSWGPVGEPHETLDAARSSAQECKRAAKVPHLDYFVYDEHGLVAAEALAAA